MLLYLGNGETDAAGEGGRLVGEEAAEGDEADQQDGHEVEPEAERRGDGYAEEVGPRVGVLPGVEAPTAERLGPARANRRQALQRGGHVRQHRALCCRIEDGFLKFFYYRRSRYNFAALLNFLRSAFSEAFSLQNCSQILIRGHSGDF